jgi:hypothetical protein
LLSLTFCYSIMLYRFDYKNPIKKSLRETQEGLSLNFIYNNYSHRFSLIRYDESMFLYSWIIWTRMIYLFDITFIYIYVR